MPVALIIGARNLGGAIIERLVGEGWTVVGAARSESTLEKVRAVGAEAIEVDVTDQGSVLGALQDVAGRHGRVDLVVNAASPYGGGQGPWGGGKLDEATPDGFDSWSVGPMRGAFAFLSACARFFPPQGGEATVIQVTGGSARRGSAGRGLWSAGSFGVRALSQAAALELREHQVHVALLIVDAIIDQKGDGDSKTADMGSLADAVMFLTSQRDRALTHELQVTPALDQWVP
jgi:3-oxoacyl-[acyl-carrier protein] reductase